jgi:hypothetical protein
MYNLNRYFKEQNMCRVYNMGGQTPLLHKVLFSCVSLSLGLSSWECCIPFFGINLVLFPALNACTEY